MFTHRLMNYFFIYSCSPMMAASDDNCEEIPGDETQSYPFCCPRLRCIDESGNNFIF